MRLPLALAAAALLAGACGAPPAARGGAGPRWATGGGAAGALAGPRSVAPAAFATGSAPEWVPLPHHLQAELRRQHPDGAVDLLHGGVRVRVTADGALERGAEPLSTGAAVRAVPLAAGADTPLLLEVRGPGSTELLRSVGWTGGLHSLRILDGRLDEAPVVGLGRVWVRERGLLRAFDLETGEPAPSTGVPAAAGHARLAFGGDGLGAFVDPLRGLMTTVDGGARWQAHARWPSATRGTPEGVTIELGPERLELTPEGALRETEPTPAGTDEPAPLRDVGARRLEHAVLRGHPDGPGRALVIERERLLRLRLTDGRVLESAPAPGLAAEDCTALALGPGVGFACTTARGPSALLGVTAPLGLRPVRAFDDARAFVPSGNGGVVVRGGCAHRAVPRRACILSPAGEATELALTGRPGRERLVSLRRGAAAVLAPEAGAEAELVLFLPGAPPRRTRLRLPPTEPDTLDAQSATWLEGWQEAPDGALRGWLMDGERLGAARVALDGAVTLGPVVTGSVAVVGGAHALVRHSLATASFSRDLGATWVSESLVLPAAARLRDGATPPRGCSAVGCTVDGWLRLWTGGAPAAEARARAPSSTSRGWFGAETPSTLRCQVTALTARPAGGAAAVDDSAWLAPPGVPASAGGPRAAGERGPGRPGPGGRARPGAGVGVGTPTGAGAAGVGTGPLWHGTDAGAVPVRGAVWGREGALSWSFRVADELGPFSTWATRLARAPWPTLEDAGARFGGVGSGPAVWRATLEPTLPAAALLLRRQGQGELVLLAEGRAPVALRGVAPNEEPAGLVRVHGVYHLGLMGTTFRVVRVLGNTVETVLTRTLERGDGASLGLGVVRDLAGQRLGLVTRSALHPGRSPGLVYPVDPDSGVVGPAEALLAPGAALAGCAPDAAGWVLRGAAATRLTLLDAAGEPLSVRRVTARWVWTDSGPCVDALGAWTDGGVAPRAVTTNAAPGIPLALRDAAGAVAELRCRAP